VWALKLAIRAYRDFYDHIWLMLLVVAAWWTLLFTVILIPSATLLLFKAADPRMGPWEERITFREASAYLWQQFGRGWKLAAACFPIILLTAFNLRFYGMSDSAMALMSPLWLLLLIVAVTASSIIFALASLQEDPAGETIRQGLRLTAMRFPAALTVLLITAVVPATIFLGPLYFLAPLVLAVPGLVAIAMTRFVLKVSGMPMPEPNKPTEERLHEKRGK
jgi:hypothetical protein